MTIKELYDALGKLMKEIPNTINDDIYHLTNDDNILLVEKVDIQFDINSIGRYIVIL